MRRRVLDLEVHIEATDLTSRTALEWYFSGFPDGDRDGEVDLDYTIRKEGDVHVLWEGQEQIAQGEAGPLLVELQKHIGDRLLRQDGYCLVHAAAVEERGRVLLLPGPSHCGKTSLCSVLVERGFRYLGDECCAIRQDLTVTPCPFPLRLRQDLVWRLGPQPAHLTIRPDVVVLGEEILFFGLPVESALTLQEQLEVGLVVFPRMAAEGVDRIERLPSGVASFVLLASILNGAHVGFSGIDLAARLAGKVGFYILSIEDVAMACQLVEQAWASR